ncbi:MAG: T9SS type A sorting domain-containing protein [Saprospiraceae bacterium]|nr:T9SS type A sorting domain-containing protein [Saprospiraceae bacterium]
MPQNKSLIIGVAICSLILGLASSGSHPTSGSAGYTGAPGDSTCGQSGCHTGGNASFDGEVIIDGLPATITTGLTYTISVTVTNPNGNATRAGFQMLVLTGTNTNAGTMANESPNTEIKTVFGGKKYFGHSPAQNFPVSNELSFSVDWTAPATVGSNPVIKFYASAVIANGNNSNSMDRVVLTNQIIPIQAGAAPLSVSITSVFGTTCAGVNNGSATAVPAGGTTPYTYVWNNGATGAQVFNLPAGLAIVTVTDNIGSTSTASTNISSPPALMAVASGSVVCQGASNGSAIVIASGGVGGYTYSWSNGGTASTLFNLPAGNYTVTVSDANSCTKTSEASVTTSPPMNLNSSLNHVRCAGGNDGSIILSVTGGVTPYTYLWSNNSTSNVLNNLTAGTYTVTVTDNVLCTKTASYIISQPGPLAVGFTNVVNATCNGYANGSATMNISGGTSSYHYQWSNGASGNGAINTQSNLSAGIYSVTATDFFDCQKTASVTISQPAPINIQVINQVPVSCFGGSNGGISISTNGQSGTVSYLWSNGATTNSLINLSAGQYHLTITDNGNACTQTASYTISQPNPLTLTVFGLTNPSCFGSSDGSAAIVASGGNSNYNYLWSNGGTTAFQNNLGAGTYVVTVTDQLACSATITANLIQPMAVSVNLISTTPASCLGANNGALNIIASNGFGPYQYLWSNGVTTASNINIPAGIYTATVTDSHACSSSGVFEVGTNSTFVLTLEEVANVQCHGDSSGSISLIANPTFTYLWSTGDTGSTLTNIPAGIYNVVATDNAGCQSQPLDITISQSPVIQSILTQSDTLNCPGEQSGLLALTLSGGTGVLSYAWSNNETSLTLDSLTSGTYSISITDSLNCEVDFQYIISETPQIIIEQANIQNVSCFDLSDGQISLIVSGGLDSLSYAWSNNATGNSLSGLNAGNYLVTISDENDCNIIETFSVAEPDSLQTEITVINETASGDNDGSIFINVVGGTSPYSILWSNGETTFTIDSLSSGVYNYEINDTNGCLVSGLVVVNAGNCLLSASYETTPATCSNSYDGVIDLNVTGSNGTFEVVIHSENGIVDSPLDSLTVGIYTLVITDTLACTALLPDIEITSIHPAIILDSLIIINPSTPDSQDGMLSVMLSGGTGTLEYVWTKDGNIIGNEPSVSNLTIGLYNLMVSDAEGCLYSINNIILEATNNSIEEFEKQVFLYPNPVNQQLNITNETGEMISRCDVSNMQGQVVFSQSVQGYESLTFNTDDLGVHEDGVYLIRLVIGGKVIIRKLMIMQ